MLQGLFYAILESLMQLAACRIDGWARKSPKRRKVYAAVLFAFMGSLALLGIICGFYMVIFPTGIADRIVGALTLVFSVGMLVWAGPGSVRYFRSPPAKE